MTRIGPYDHQRVERKRRILRWLIDNIGWRFLVRIRRVEGVENVPPAGPAVLIYNHIAFVDPIVVLGNMPRNTVPLAKVEAYSYPVVGIFPWLWEVIPVRREEADRDAVVRAVRVLEAGETILVAPEGTRGPALQRAKEGFALLAARTASPVVPVAIEGTDRFPTLSPARWRKGGVVVRFGRAFRFLTGPGRTDRRELRIMADEAMYQLAALLPPSRRGVYADLSNATTARLDFV
jgi:1-acyl-sn-glycerol-3-phosphate acyltransferase